MTLIVHVPLRERRRQRPDDLYRLHPHADDLPDQADDVKRVISGPSR